MPIFWAATKCESCEEAKRRKNLTTSELFFRRSKKQNSPVFTKKVSRIKVSFESDPNSKQFGPKIRLISLLNPRLISDFFVAVFLFVSIFLRISK